ncbi:hypothetical protein I546_6246 [Mycobacterium kansasii 732]|nr:hypothetical protein [Mycobacterium gastri]EUA02265.1 hypothetical protein I546_6246 [Mycobacterium kansasii 732]
MLVAPGPEAVGTVPAQPGSGVARFARGRRQCAALDELLFGVSQVNTELGATSMKVWYRAKAAARH